MDRNAWPNYNKHAQSRLREANERPWKRPRVSGENGDSPRAGPSTEKRAVHAKVTLDTDFELRKQPVVDPSKKSRALARVDPGRLARAAAATARAPSPARPDTTEATDDGQSVGPGAGHSSDDGPTLRNEDETPFSRMSRLLIQVTPRRSDQKVTSMASVTPLTSRMRKFDIPGSVSTTVIPDRKLTPFNAFAKSVLPGKDAPTSPMTELRAIPMPALKFSMPTPSGSRLKAISALEHPLSTKPGLEDFISSTGVDRGEGFEGVDDETRELRRGLLISPEKGVGRRGGGKFIKNGYAERAQHLITRSQTAYALWQKDVGSAMRTNADSSTSSTSKAHARTTHSRVPLPDIRLRVLKILHTTRFPFPSFLRTIDQISEPLSDRHLATATKSLLTLCQVLDERKLDGLKMRERSALVQESSELDLDDGAVDGSRGPGSNDNTILVLFSFASPSARLDDRLVKDLRVKEGTEISAWKPLYEVEHDAPSTTSDGSRYRALLCSRFSIISSQGTREYNAEEPHMGSEL